MAEGDLARIKIHTESYTGGDEVALGFVSTSGVTDWRTILLNGFAELVLPIWFAGLAGITTLNELVIQDVVPGTEDDIEYDGEVDPFGGVSAEPVPPQCSAKIIWRTALQGRSFRGASFIPALPVTRLSTGSEEWNGLATAYLQSVVDVMMLGYGPMGTSTFGRFVIISRWENGVLRDPPIGTQVVAGDWQTTLRTQRRRARRFL